MLVDVRALQNQHAPSSLLNECRAHYHRFVELVAHVHAQQTDAFLLQLLGEDLHEFYTIVDSVSFVCYHNIISYALWIDAATTSIHRSV